MQPRRIGDYQILEEIGRGGMGVVFRVRDERSGQLIALKMLAPEAQSHKDSALRFKREFRAIRRVVHPNVVRVFEAGAYHGSPYFTMELVDGTNIRSWLDNNNAILHLGKDAPPSGPLDADLRKRLNEPARVRRLAEATIQVCFALSTIHSHRIVHRDLKPDNILVTPQGVVKLMDFGIAKQLSDHGPSTSGGMVVGTFKYLSPEQALGLDVDGRADLYCLGIVLYELLAGRHPFFSETSVGYAYHHARSQPAPISRYNPEVEPGIAEVAQRLLAKEAGDRYATAEDLIAAIKETVSGLDDRIRQLRASTKRFALPPFQLSPHPLYAPALVGRDREKQVLHGAVDRLLDGRGRFIRVQGPVGSGKSRLLRTVGVEAREQEVPFLFGRAVASERAPYAPFVEIFDHVIRQLSTRPRREVQRILGSEGPALARYLPAVAALPMIESRSVAALAPEDEQIRFRAAAADVLARYCEDRPHVLVIDDAQHCDELSVDLLRHIAGTLGGLDVAGGQPASRSTVAIFIGVEEVEASAPLSALLSEFEGQSAYIPLTLHPVDVAAAGRLLRSMLGGAAVSTDLAQAVFEGSDGNPYRVEERIRAMAEAGDLARRSGRWVVRSRLSSPQHSLYVAVDEIEAEDIPEIHDRDQAAGGRRLQSLSATALDVIERAAVVGLQLSSALLFRIALRPEEELLDALDELIKRDVLIEDKREGRYSFVNDEMRTSLLAALAPDKRARLHLLAAHSMEEIGRQDATRPADPELLATHYLEGGEPRRAFDYLAQAAQRAVQANAVQAAEDLVRRAQSILDQEQGNPRDAGLARRRLDLLRLRLDVLLTAGRPAEAVELGSRELAVLRLVGEARLVAEVVYRLAQAELTLGELDGALQRVAEVISVTQRGGAHSLRCKIKRLAGDIYLRRGRSGHAMDYYRDSLDLARAIGDGLEEELVRGAIADVRLASGDVDHAQRDYENLLALAEQKGERSRAARYVKCLGRVQHDRGQYNHARASYQRALEMAKAIGDARTQHVCLLRLGELSVDEGNIEAALGFLQNAQQGLMDAGATAEVVACLLARAEAQLIRNADDSARILCDEAAAEAEHSGMALLLAHARIIRGLVRVRMHQQEAGIDDIDRGLATVRRAELTGVVLLGEVYLGEALVLAGDQARGLATLQAVQQRAQDRHLRRYADRVKHARARLQVTAPS